MLQAGITKVRNEVVCAIGDPEVAALAQERQCTRAAAAMELLAPRLAGAIVAIGNAPTALGKLLEIVRGGGPRPALVVGLPVGLVGAGSEAGASGKRSVLHHQRRRPRRQPRGGRGRQRPGRIGIKRGASFMNKRTLALGAIFLAALVFWPAPAQAMHISEGGLPPSWAGLWFLVAAPFWFWGLRTIQRRRAADPVVRDLGGAGRFGDLRHLLHGRAGPCGPARCSHPCGTGLGAILIGPGPTVVVASIALLLQALFLAHGGLTTLGGQYRFDGRGRGLRAATACFRASAGCGCRSFPRRFSPGLLSDWATYAMAALELAAGPARRRLDGSHVLPLMPRSCAHATPLGHRRGRGDGRRLPLRVAPPSRTAGAAAPGRVRRRRKNMKRLHTLLTIVVLAVAPLCCRSVARAAEADWQGADDKIEEIAKAAGHPAREPYINLVQGDLGLFVFLLAGAVGGFVAGYAFRNLFPPGNPRGQSHFRRTKIGTVPSRSKIDHAPNS